MSSWIGLLGLYLIQQVVLFCALCSGLFKRRSLPLQPASTKQASLSPPKCVAVVLVDPVKPDQDAQKLALILSWQVMTLV